MQKMTVSVSESQAERIDRRMDENESLNRSEALREELQASNHRSEMRKTLDVAATSVGAVGLLLVGLTFFMNDAIRTLALAPVMGSSVLFIVGYLIDAPGLPGVVRHE